MSRLRNAADPHWVEDKLDVHKNPRRFGRSGTLRPGPKYPHSKHVVNTDFIFR